MATACLGGVAHTVDEFEEHRRRREGDDEIDRLVVGLGEGGPDLLPAPVEPGRPKLPAGRGGMLGDDRWQRLGEVGPQAGQVLGDGVDVERPVTQHGVGSAGEAERGLGLKLLLGGEVAVDGAVRHPGRRGHRRYRHLTGAVTMGQSEIGVDDGGPGFGLLPLPQRAGRSSLTVHDMNHAIKT